MKSPESRLRHFHASFFATIMGVAGLVLVLKPLRVVANGSVFQRD
jgi:hypothetical protein